MLLPTLRVLNVSHDQRAFKGSSCFEWNFSSLSSQGTQAPSEKATLLSSCQLLPSALIYKSHVTLGKSSLPSGLYEIMVQIGVGKEVYLGLKHQLECWEVAAWRLCSEGF